MLSQTVTRCIAESIEAEVRELRREIQLIDRERDILRKALAIFGRQE